MKGVLIIDRSPEARKRLERGIDYLVSLLPRVEERQADERQARQKSAEAAR